MKHFEDEIFYRKDLVIEETFEAGSEISATEKAKKGIAPSELWSLLPAPRKELYSPRSPNGQKLAKKDKNLEQMKKLGFAYVGFSMLTVWQRPTKLQVKLLKETLGISMIVSVLAEDERPKEIASYCAENGMRHLWIKLAEASQDELEDEDEMKRLQGDLKKLFKELNESRQKVLLHCAAGIHRTGVCAYALLRWSGLHAKAAFDVMYKMRKETATGVAEWRIRLAE